MSLTYGILPAYYQERSRAIEKHGFERTPANPAMSNEKRLVILVEEIGEVARAMTYDEGDRAKLVAELIQLGTMAFMSVEGIEAADGGQ